MDVSEWQRVLVNGHYVSHRTIGSPDSFPLIFMHGGTQDGQ